MSTIAGTFGQPEQVAEPVEQFAQALFEMEMASVGAQAQRFIDVAVSREPSTGAVDSWGALQARYLRPSENHFLIGIGDSHQPETSPIFQVVASSLEVHADTLLPASFSDDFDPLSSIDLLSDSLSRENYDPVVAEVTAKCVDLVTILGIHEVVAYEDTTALKYAMSALMKLRQNVGPTQRLSGHTFQAIMQFLKNAMVVAEMEQLQGKKPEEEGHAKNLRDELVEVFMIHARASGAMAFRPE